MQNTGTRRGWLAVAAGLLLAPALLASPGRTTLADAPPLLAHPVPLSAVRLLDGPLRRAQELDAVYLLQLDPDRLLSGTRSENGLPPRAPKYGGWEVMGVHGHTLGHYLSACSQMFAATGREIFREKVAYCVAELAAVQAHRGDGYCGGLPGGDRIFADLRAGRFRADGFALNGLWVPWYTLHKLFAGLLDAHALAGLESALTVARGFGDWIAQTVGGLTDEQFQTMLQCEHGGLNESLAELAARTGDERYLALSRRFHHRAILDPLGRGEDVLPGHHANTQIPKAIGCARRWQLAGDPLDRAIAENFWDFVVEHHTYVMGGHSDHEWFGPEDVLGRRMSGSMVETCNTYNMLKLSEALFSWRPTARVADFYERALYNHILTSIDPRTGLTAYKYGLMGGWFQSFATPFDSFWCCTGTGLENHARYGAFVYAQGDRQLWVNLFVPSVLTWPGTDVTLRQETAFPEGDETTLTLACPRPMAFRLSLRRPGWADDCALWVNDRPTEAKAGADGYFHLERTWRDGDRVRLKVPFQLAVEPTPDLPDRIALRYGPIVLAADLGTEGMPPDGPYGKQDSAGWGTNLGERMPVLVGAERPVDEWVKPVEGQPLRFRTVGVGQPAELDLLPFYASQHRRFSIYFDRYTPDRWAAELARREAERQRLARLDAGTVDRVLIGQRESEAAHNLQGDRTSAGQFQQRWWRHAGAGGWFSYELTLPGRPVDLLVTYWGSDVGRTFQVLVDGAPLVTQTLENNRPGEFFDVLLPLDEALWRGKTRLTVRFQGINQSFAGGVFDLRLLARE